MRALPASAEALPQAPPGGMIPPAPSDFYVALEVCSRSGMDELDGFFDGFALMGRFRMDAGQPCMKAWRKERRGRGGGEKFAGIPVFWKRLLLSPAHPLKNHLL